MTGAVSFQRAVGYRHRVLKTARESLAVLDRVDSSALDKRIAAKEFARALGVLREVSRQREQVAP